MYCFYFVSVLVYFFVASVNWKSKKSISMSVMVKIQNKCQNQWIGYGPLVDFCNIIFYNLTDASKFDAQTKLDTTIDDP